MQRTHFGSRGFCSCLFINLTADSGVKIRFRVLFQSAGSISAVSLTPLCVGVCVSVVVEKGTVEIFSSHTII